MSTEHPHPRHLPHPELFTEDFDPDAAAARHNHVLLPAAALLLVTLLAMATLAIALATSRDQASVIAATGLRLTDAQTRGRDLFTHRCGRCHTLSVVGSRGHVGPDFDAAAPSGLAESFVATTIAGGMVRGNGTMPSGVYTGRDAADVADFLSAVTRDLAAARARRLTR